MKLFEEPIFGRTGYIFRINLGSYVDRLEADGLAKGHLLLKGVGNAKSIYHSTAITRCEDAIIAACDDLGMHNINLGPSSVYHTLHSGFRDLRSDSFSVVGLRSADRELICGVGAKRSIQQWEELPAKTAGESFAVLGRPTPAVTELLHAKSKLVIQRIMFSLDRAGIKYSAMINDPHLCVMNDKLISENVRAINERLMVKRPSAMAELSDDERIDAIVELRDRSWDRDETMATLIYDKQTNEVRAFNPQTGLYLLIDEVTVDWGDELHKAALGQTDGVEGRFVALQRDWLMPEVWANIQSSTEIFLVDAAEYLQVAQCEAICIPDPNTGDNPEMLTFGNEGFGLRSAMGK